MIVKKGFFHNNINQNIKAAKVRLVGPNVNNGIYRLEDALRMSKEMDLDLVQISRNDDNVVCKIIDYSKFLYERKKKQKQLRAKSANTTIKEIRFGPETDQHDYEFKKRHAIKFLQSGFKLRAIVFFKGRSIMFKDRGKIILLKLADEIQQYAKVENFPKLEGRRFVMLLSPKK